MERRNFALLAEPRDDLCCDLLDFAVKECRVVLLVIQKTLPALNEHGREVMSQLERFLISAAESAQWPGGGVLFEEWAARVFRYSYGPECADVLKKATNRLYGWLQPELPEDLCLLRDEEDPWLVSIAHERDSYFCLSQDEKVRLLDALPQLATLLRED